MAAPRVRETMGTLRVKANVSSAKVYIDDALVGTVDEFDGLTEHLELLGGPHKFELRAEGYKTFTKDIKVEVGRTQTVRASLRKK